MAASSGRWIGRPNRRPPPTPTPTSAPPAPAPPPERVVLAPPQPFNRPLGPVPACIFCNRPAGSVEYAWPEWLCRFVTDQLAVWNKERSRDPAVLERMRREVDQTVHGVCDACSRGWMQRLEDNVSPFLQSMIAGEPTPLSPGRRRILARWAAKTAVVMECACDAPIRTPRSACEYVRGIGVHPGTQVLVGRYDGEQQVLTHERDLFSRYIEGRKHSLSQSSFVIGKVFIQVFADPWRDSTPELEESAIQPLIALLPSQRGKVEWPPDVAIDDSRYELVRCGGVDDDAGAAKDARSPAHDDAGAANRRHEVGSQPTL